VTLSLARLGCNGSYAVAAPVRLSRVLLIERISVALSFFLRELGRLERIGGPLRLGHHVARPAGSLDDVILAHFVTVARSGMEQPRMLRLMAGRIVIRRSPIMSARSRSPTA